MSRDPRDGLQRRYTLDEILELNGGKHRIHPLNYDALKVIRDPLYVKMGQTLSEANTDQNERILSELQKINNTRSLTSATGVPWDQLEALLKKLMGGFPTMDPMDTDEDETGDGSGSGNGQPPPPPGQPPGPSGGGSMPEPGEEPEGRDPPRQLDGTLGPFVDENRSNRRPPPGPAASALFRNNIELEAQIHELSQEMKKRSQQDTVIREVRQGISQPDPVREIVREFREVLIPTPIPVVPPREDNSALIAALQQAMRHNQDLAAFASHMGMSMTQLVELMRAQGLERAKSDVRKPEEPVQVTQSSQPPPPPPPPPALVREARSRSTKPETQPVAKPEAQPVPARPERSRSVAKPTTAPVRPSAAPARPSTAPVRPSATPVAINQPGRSASRPPVPAAQDIRVPSSVRAASMASTVDYGSRSRSRGGIVLPISDATKDTEDTKRGRSPTDRVSKATEQLLKSQNRALVKGQIRHHIGQFARSFAASTNEKRKEAKATRATSVAPTRSFDQIDELSKEDVPWGAGLAKQRTSSEGGHLYRFKGQLVR